MEKGKLYRLKMYLALWKEDIATITSPHTDIGDSSIVDCSKFGNLTLEISPPFPINDSSIMGFPRYFVTIGQVVMCVDQSARTGNLQLLVDDFIGWTDGTLTEQEFEEVDGLEEG